MNHLSILIASGLRSRMESLDLLANNLANAGNPGFKADRESYSLYVSAEALEAAAREGYEPTLAPVIEATWTDYSQGDLNSTGRELDLAISGDGFFVVRGPQGFLLTRDGAFRLSPSGELVTKDGYPVLGAGRQPLRVQPGRPVTIERNGEVLQGGQRIGQLEIAAPPSRGASLKRQGNYFMLSLSSADLRSASSAEVHQGFLEAANVSPAKAAVRLVDLLRQFESLQRAMQVNSEMNRAAVNDVASPS